MKLEVISVKKIFFKGEVDTLVVPGAKGDFKVLPRHASLLSTLTKGEIVYTVDGKESRLAIEYGFVEVSDDNIIVCIGETN